MLGGVDVFTLEGDVREDDAHVFLGDEVVSVEIVPN